MQDKYVSLNPEFAEKLQQISDREILWRQRYEESRGGPLARQVGFLFGLTASTYFYYRAQKNGLQSLFPLQRTNSRHYTFILVSGFLAYNFGANMVASMTGDGAQQGYLYRNRA